MGAESPYYSQQRSNITDLTGWTQGFRGRIQSLWNTFRLSWRHSHIPVKSVCVKPCSLWKTENLKWIFWNRIHFTALTCWPVECEWERRPSLTFSNKSPRSKEGRHTHTHTHNKCRPLIARPIRSFPLSAFFDPSHCLICCAVSSFSLGCLSFINLSPIKLRCFRPLCLYSLQWLADETGLCACCWCRLLLSHLSRIRELWSKMRR